MDIRGLGNTCVVGLQWGDEGKGQIVDYLSENFDVLVRYSGGANAGHTVTVGDTRLGLHLVPSGILHEKVLCVIANGVALDPEVLFQEVDALRAKGVKVGDNLRISDRAHVVMPYHKLEDKLSEASLNPGAKIGTTGRGIGPCYSDKASRSNAIRVHHFIKPQVFRQRLGEIVARKNRVLRALYGADPLDAEDIYCRFSAYAERLAPFVCDTADLLHCSLAAGKRVLFEGAQGNLLDVDHGTFPFVTSSNSGACGVSPGSGVPGRAISTFLGVAKAYTTRVGDGAMPTELTNSVGQTIRERGREYGTTTGRPRRCGWFDGVATAYSVRLGGFNAIGLVGLNVLSEFEGLNICTGYEVDGRRLAHFPSDPDVLEQVRPILEPVRGWKQDLSGCKNWDDLPAAARDYLGRIEGILGAPIVAVAVGPQRSQLLLRPS
jgi:adenylosuccinate synthase